MSACLLSPVGVVCMFTPLSQFTPFFPFPLLLLLPLLPFLTPSTRSTTSFTIRPLLEHLNSFNHYVDDILAYKHIRSHLDGVALQNEVNIIVNWIESTRL